MAQSNDFKKQVRVALLMGDHNYSWLAEEVHKLTGLYCSQAYVSKTLNGERHSPNIIKAIKQILEIEDE